MLNCADTVAVGYFGLYSAHVKRSGLNPHPIGVPAIRRWLKRITTPTALRQSCLL
jgi:hypothetical protein